MRVRGYVRPKWSLGWTSPPATSHFHFMDYNSHNAGFPQSHSSLFHVFLLCFLCSSALALVALLTQCDNPYPPPADLFCGGRAQRRRGLPDVTGGVNGAWGPCKAGRVCVLFRVVKRELKVALCCQATKYMTVAFVSDGKMVDHSKGMYTTCRPN